MNVSESVRRLLAEKETTAAERAVRVGGVRRSAGDWRLRQPTGEDLRRWARGQERLGRKERLPATRSASRRQRQVAPNARELFPVLRDMRLAARPVLGFTEEHRPVYGPSTFRNVIDAEGRHV